MSKTTVRIKLKAFEHKSLDKACAKIVEVVKRTVVKLLVLFHFQQKLKRYYS